MKVVSNTLEKVNKSVVKAFSPLVIHYCLSDWGVPSIYSF